MFASDNVGGNSRKSKIIKIEIIAIEKIQITGLYKIKNTQKKII